MGEVIPVFNLKDPNLIAPISYNWMTSFSMAGFMGAVCLVEEGKRTSEHINTSQTVGRPTVIWQHSSAKLLKSSKRPQKPIMPARKRTLSGCICEEPNFSWLP
jgi:hypothetical protein